MMDRQFSLSYMRMFAICTPIFQEQMIRKVR
jgi:hypothetical protein